MTQTESVKSFYSCDAKKEYEFTLTKTLAHLVCSSPAIVVTAVWFCPFQFVPSAPSARRDGDLSASEPAWAAIAMARRASCLMDHTRTQQMI